MRFPSPRTSLASLAGRQPVRQAAWWSCAKKSFHSRNDNSVRKQPIRAGEALIPPKNLQRMKDSTLLLGQAESLRTQYQKDGYLLIRDLIDKTSILDARQKILDRLFSLKRVQSYDDPRPINGTHGVALFTDLDLHQSKEVKKALESTALFDFFRVFFGEAAATYTYKWLRAVGVGEFTGAHLDKVYMGRGSQELMTAWIPLGETSVEMGSVLVCPSTHNAKVYEQLRATYGKLDVDRDVPNDPGASGHLTDNPLTWAPKTSSKQTWDTELNDVPLNSRVSWVTEDFNPGDVLFFGISTLHMSTTNVSNEFRLSCDTRWQPASKPVDERWAGAPGDGRDKRLFCGDRPGPPI